MLGIRLLNFLDINHYQTVPYAQVTYQQDFDLYFQLVDLSQNVPVPYVPSVSNISGASGSVLFAGLTSGSVVTVTIAGIAFSQAFSIDIPTTVTALAGQINASSTASKLVVATPSGSSLDLESPVGLGAFGNNFALNALVSTGTGSATVSGSYLTGGNGAGSAILQVQVLNLNDALVVTRFASQPFFNIDASIWKLSLLSSDPMVPGTANMRVTLTENVGSPKYAYSQSAIRIMGTTQGLTQPGGASSPFPGQGSFPGQNNQM